MARHDPGTLLTSPDFFPAFADLFEDDEVDLRYYDFDDETEAFEPVKHWCLLVEIISVNLGTPGYFVKDRAGETFPISISRSDFEATVSEEFLKAARPGNTLSLMYPSLHTFLRGVVGVELEGIAPHAKAYPCSLERFLALEHELDTSRCAGCQSSARFTCKSCGVVKYCGKECQVTHWKSSHKQECRAVKQISLWKGREWDEFDDFWYD